MRFPVLFNSVINSSRFKGSLVLLFVLFSGEGKGSGEVMGSREGKQSFAVALDIAVSLGDGW